eukprot:TRINITY_DN64195_c0_g1_i2.p1 TRINITY_DN64195_c0_g1~~TRINITY_DN64195_c0_g1_i2.p1  ORF type:complete len:228 (-),score=25.69 TRINITY_DN64195_c0_g1_i2:100-783(-)
MRAVMKAGPNQGKTFLSCSKTAGKDCGYFAWCDEAGRPEVSRVQQAQLPPGPACSCGYPSTGQHVKKTGANTGRPFYRCAKLANGVDCNFFKWGDEIATHEQFRRSVPHGQRVVAGSQFDPYQMLHCVFPQQIEQQQPQMAFASFAQNPHQQQFGGAAGAPIGVAQASPHVHMQQHHAAPSQNPYQQDGFGFPAPQRPSGQQPVFSPVAAAGFGAAAPRVAHRPTPY